MATDELFLLDIKNEGDKGTWISVQVEGPTPGRRYGHTMAYKNAYIFLFGGHSSVEATNDTWILSIGKLPFKWEKLEFKAPVPDARIYHSMSAWYAPDSTGTVAIFGGRGKDQTSLNDMWVLNKKPDSTWEWNAVPYKSKEVPSGRYQVIICWRESIAFQLLH